MDRMLQNARNELLAAQWMLRMERKHGNDFSRLIAERKFLAALDRLWDVQQMVCPSL